MTPEEEVVKILKITSKKIKKLSNTLYEKEGCLSHGAYLSSIKGRVEKAIQLLEGK